MRQTVPLFCINDSTTLDKPEFTETAQVQQGACFVKIYPANVNGSMIPLNASTEKTVFGRGHSCDFEMLDDFASREHAAVTWKNGSYHIQDLGSTNGTYVNDRKITEQALSPGDQIRIGHHIFKYLSSDHVEAMYHEAVFQMMTVDALTQTYNRRYFEGAFDREVTRTIRHGRTLGLMVFDIDRFKDINDQYGHLVGDEILAGLCKRIHSRIRGDEVFARIGGEEFALVCVELNQTQLLKLAEELRTLVCERPFKTSKGDIEVSVSIGVVHTNGLMPNTPRELMEQADAKLYKAKDLGRNKVCI